ncbi:LuxR C-terminal-related transcriptional regulator [Nocardia sp. NPDC004860]|uniref:helix-turn-helix transcriptional regulator n=1 Tax=Nocardia sp. NPDC004860 TaxID=3154557 RepID=UPI0033B9AC36
MNSDIHDPAGDGIWLALSALIHADRLVDVAVYCEQILRRPGRELPRGVFEAVILGRARVDILTGRACAAVEELTSLLAEGVSVHRRGLAMAWLLEALAQLGETGHAHQLLLGGRLGSVEELPDVGHLAAARGALHWAEGDMERCVEAYLECGRILTSLNVVNPAVVPWRSRASLAASVIGRSDLALALAEDELAAARQWGAPGTVGAALHALGMARRDSRSITVLERSIELLELANTRYELIPALCDLGVLYAERDDLSRSRDVLRTVSDIAVGAKNKAWLNRVESVLPTIDGKQDTARLTKQERKVAQLALEGHSNKAIAETMFLTVRTVEFHLSNVYRKLDITGRRELRGRLNPRECA